ncbi:hypothetical protein [Streptomyces sp. NPDC020489]|uniref:hypothetical protein n=1 Tax=Streptomyces sp. NPDC020489 TaxID=3365077 RepID=UPI0037B4E906
MTRDTTPRTSASTEYLCDLIPRVRYVLWDLDGPICRLFAVHSASDVAKEMIPRIHELAGPSGVEHQQHEQRRQPVV